MTKKNRIQLIDSSQAEASLFKRYCVSCIVLTYDQKILLQQRGFEADHFPGYLSAFGGGIEPGEAPLETLVRELQEELGAKVKDAVHLSTFTEAATGFSELVYGYFWHDVDNTITGCYEGEPKYFSHMSDVLNHPIITDDVPWLLQLSQEKSLI